MTSKTYKAIFVPPELHDKIKMEALKNKKTMIDFIADLLTHPTLLKP